MAIRQTETDKSQRRLSLNKETVRNLVSTRAEEEKWGAFAGTRYTCTILSCGGGTCTCPPPA
ncbi:MAG TPA: hypothetical protein VFA07_12200 [Chthonomonadaceae bacterium]|nr:hypothetical protein [Chthonomonadaceae bacterium]